MKTYANAEEKTTILTLFTMQSWAERLAVAPPQCVDKPTLRQRARHIDKHLDKLIEAAISDLDEDAQKGMYKFASQRDVMIVPSDKAKANKDKIILDVADFDYIMSRVFSDCGTCLKTTTEVKQCRLKKILLSAGALPESTPRGECPYQP